VALEVKNPPAMQETWVPSPGQEDALAEGMATHSSILAWRIHGQRSLVGYSPWGCKESDTTEVTSHAGTHSWDYVWTLYSAIDTYVCFCSSIKLL